VRFFEVTVLEPGHIFASRYRIRRCIAEGGMAVIFEAEHLATERRVALKLLFPHLTNIDSAREKFELEAKISARVNSPHIVQVLDAGVDPATGSPFLAMELLEGETLARRIATHGPLPPERALPFLEQVAAGLDAAHGYREPGGAAKPIVHRDLKPENLFLAPAPGGSGGAKILDFGIAKVLDDGLHVSQEIRGTPLFMAAEQITGGPLSPQTDIWAYGLIAHYVLTGAHYWRTAGLENASVQALFAEIVTLPLDAPSARWRELQLASSLPPAFDGWLLRCIDRQPARRFPAAGVAFEALQRALEEAAPSRSGAPLTATAGGAAPLQRSRSLAAAAGVALVAAGVAAWAVGGSEPRAPSAASPAPPLDLSLDDEPASPALPADVDLRRVRVAPLVDPAAAPSSRAAASKVPPPAARASGRSSTDRLPSRDRRSSSAAQSAAAPRAAQRGRGTARRTFAAGEAYRMR
jgi:serine/threonine-protein kinase